MCRDTFCKYTPTFHPTTPPPACGPRQHGVRIPLAAQIYDKAWHHGEPFGGRGYLRGLFGEWRRTHVRKVRASRALRAARKQVRALKEGA